jgi:hypothetical protein
MKAQAEVGRKYAFGNEAPNSGNSFKMYTNDTFISDNTYLFHSDSGSMVYLTHNVMNYLGTTDPYYIKETEFVLDKLLQNSNLVSEVNTKDRNRFFAQIEHNIMSLRRKIELAIDDLTFG